ncbi:YlxR family protein [Saccharomonospora azurea]|uniref:Nucleic-acid-binding protein implicated in transcription termination n=1 Tax=Saccharomonospora azurea NA-128 TaxID=882081 RepID=H8G620_9PSEU|nr:YlxR family protein [Saccharomonospora azurea]EHK80369.1 putative nucleic-acid-binding protein implicated in transcription termination [Saccharomonospora azurea SZMC 14600]EHY91297.1 putative nucleic-acid-binding protein implicated in transcription termination [Saccharomonospora azurea NA-128]
MVRHPQPTSTRRTDETSPVRLCVGCRQRESIGALSRVVASDGRLVVDERRRLPGRGAWLHPHPDCLSKAERRRAFPRALRVKGMLDTSSLRHHVERHTESKAGVDLPRPERTRKQVDPS